MGDIDKSMRVKSIIMATGDEISIANKEAQVEIEALKAENDRLRDVLKKINKEMNDDKRRRKTIRSDRKGDYFVSESLDGVVFSKRLIELIEAALQQKEG